MKAKFANVRQNRNLGRTFCPANFLLQQIKFDFLIRLSFECTFVFMSDQVFLLSDQNGAPVGHMSFQVKKIICSPALTSAFHGIIHFLSPCPSPPPPQGWQGFAKEVDKKSTLWISFFKECGQKLRVQISA